MSSPSDICIFEEFIPCTPFGKQRPQASAVNGSVHIYTPQKTLSAESEVKFYVTKALREKAIYFNFDVSESALFVSLSLRIVRPKTAKRKHVTVKPDLDNCIKLFFDACNGILWRDDSQIVRILADKIYVDDWKDVGYFVRVCELA
jgi:Holliday junction resolvase RusA-like endonuclease